MSAQSFVINLDRAPERLVHFEAQARAAGITFERLSAVDGHLMLADDCAAWQNPSTIYPLSRPEIGCIISHKKAWKKIVESGTDWGAVFEDDVYLSTELGHIIERLDEVPEEIDIIKLEAIGNRSVLLDKNELYLAGRSLRRLRGLALGAAGYLISRKACQRLLQTPHLPSLAIDMYLFSLWHGAYRGLNIYVLDPAPVIQSNSLNPSSGNVIFPSQISDRGKALVPRLSLAKRLKREWYRFRAQIDGIGAEPVILDWR